MNLCCLFNMQYSFKLGIGVREVGSHSFGRFVQGLSAVASPGASSDAIHQVQCAAHYLRVRHQG